MGGGQLVTITMNPFVLWVLGCVAVGVVLAWIVHGVGWADVNPFRRFRKRNH
jgi:hypothetical protein